MRNNFLLISMVFVAVTVSNFSCKRDYSLVATNKTTGGTSYLAIVHASPNFRNIFSMPDSFNVFINGNKISGFNPGTASPFMSYGATFPPNSTGFGYIAVPSGVQNIKFSVSGINNADSLPIIAFTKTFYADHQYSLIITDSIKSTRDSSQIFVEDVYNFPPTQGYYNLRFINTVINDTASVDLYSYVKNAVIYSKVKPGGITGFSQIGINRQIADTLYVTRSLPAGMPSNSPLASRIILGKMAFQAGDQKSYTVYFRGDINLMAPDAKRSLLTYYRNE